MADVRPPQQLGLGGWWGSQSGRPPGTALTPSHPVTPPLAPSTYSIPTKRSGTGWTEKLRQTDLEEGVGQHLLPAQDLLHRAQGTDQRQHYVSITAHGFYYFLQLDEKPLPAQDLLQAERVAGRRGGAGQSRHAGQGCAKQGAGAFAAGLMWQARAFASGWLQGPDFAGHAGASAPAWPTHSSSTANVNGKGRGQCTCTNQVPRMQRPGRVGHAGAPQPLSMARPSSSSGIRMDARPSSTPSAGRTFSVRSVRSSRQPQLMSAAGHTAAKAAASGQKSRLLDSLGCARRCSWRAHTHGLLPQPQRTGVRPAGRPVPGMPAREAVLDMQLI